MSGQATFSRALEAVRDGRKIARFGWNGKGMYLFLVQGWTGVPYEHSAFPRHPFIAMKTADNKLVPWVASQTDVLAMDWEILG